MSYREFFSDCGFSPNPSELRTQRDYSPDTRSMEYTGCNTGDFRISCVDLVNADGSSSAEFRFKDFSLQAGKYSVPGMPASYDNGNECETLRIDLWDTVTGLEVSLYYGVFEKTDMITRCAVFHNGSDAMIKLYKAASGCLDLPFGKWDLIHFHGRHSMERMPERNRVSHAIVVVGSNRGASSHHENPFVILAAPDTGELVGECYGAMLVYSGNFKMEVQCSQLQSTRLVAGISEDRFCWQLDAGADFHTPEMLLCYSAEGLEKLSSCYHRFISRNICRGAFKTKRRPVLINNWEATYFDFDAERIFSIARQARELGIEMLVLDDGWFGRRINDRGGLGDWSVNEEKLGFSLSLLISKIRSLDMEFGIWIEPEMVSVDSDLYAHHPDWVLAIPGRSPVFSREQLVLDMGRKEVADYLYGVFSGLLNEQDISYVKWDMNRHIADAFSHGLPAERQGEVLHRYILGVYDLLERLTTGFPHVLFEGCSGGGGRFDAGMLHYFPQIWCSDNTDAIARLKIQYGTSFGYPTQTVGSHVSAVPNHQTGRTTPLTARGTVAMSGAFGYELDLQQLSDKEKQEVRDQVEQFKRDQELISHGTYHRLTNAMTDDFFTAWQFSAEDQSGAFLNVVVIDPKSNPYPIHIRLRGLAPHGIYEERSSGRRFTGEALMYGGYTLPILIGDYPSMQLYFDRI